MTTNLLGNKKALTLLQKSIKNQKVAHAYLFSGPEGVGKKLFALHFAKILNCEKKGISPCEVCNSCVKITKSLHPDIMVLMTEAKQIKIDTIKNLSSFIQSPPFEGSYKVAIIDDAHKMNPKAANALLKTLEEPSSSSVIILVTDLIKNLLPTIVSRCLKISFAPLNDEELSTILLEKGYNRESIKKILPFCNGSVQKGLNLLEPENSDFVSLVNDFSENLENKNFSQITSLADLIVEKNNEELFFQILVNFFRNRIVHLYLDERGVTPEIFGYINKLEKTINFAKLLRYNISRSFLIETLLISFRKCEEK